MHKIIFILFKNIKSGDLYPLDINIKPTLDLAKTLFALSAYRANDISDFIEQGRHHRQTREGSQPVAALTLWLTSMDEIKIEQIKSEAQYSFDDVWYFEVQEKIVLNKHQMDCNSSFTQYALISKRPDISKDSFFEHWHDHHTEIAIKTQSTFSYIQNTITKSSSKSLGTYLAVVEESFPIKALCDPMIFYAASSKETLKYNLDLMMHSCQKFLNFDEIIVFPTRQLNLL